MSTQEAPLLQSSFGYASGKLDSLNSAQNLFDFEDSVGEIEPEFDIYTTDQAEAFQRFRQELLLEESNEKPDSEVSSLLNLETRDQRADSGESRLLLELSAAILESCDMSKAMQSTAASINNDVVSNAPFSLEFGSQEYFDTSSSCDVVKTKIIARDSTQKSQLIKVIGKLIDRESISVKIIETLSEN